MTRLLVLLAVVLFLAYLAGRGIARLRDKLGELLNGPEVAGQGKAANRQKIGSQLVPCSFCGVHFPRSRAIHRDPGDGPRSATALYCSQDCQRQAAKPVNDVTRSRSA